MFGLVGCYFQTRSKYPFSPVPHETGTERQHSRQVWINEEGKCRTEQQTDSGKRQMPAIFQPQRQNARNFCCTRKQNVLFFRLQSPPQALPPNGRNYLLNSPKEELGYAVGSLFSRFFSQSIKKLCAPLCPLWCIKEIICGETKKCVLSQNLMVYYQ